MKKPKRVRRFRVGQVVAVRIMGGFHGDACLGWRYESILDYDPITKLCNLGSITGLYKESELRPLTAKEIGPRR